MERTHIPIWVLGSSAAATMTVGPVLAAIGGVQHAQVEPMTEAASVECDAATSDPRTHDRAGGQAVDPPGHTIKV